MVDFNRKFDVLVIGGGNAALCAAVSARRAGASVLVLEGAPKFYRGGNTRHTRNMRCAHDAATDILTGPYTEQEFWEDLLRVTGGETDEELARHMIRESKDILGWVVEQGVRWQPSLGGTLSLGRTNSFFLGGGRAMLNALYLTAEQLGVEILYDAEVLDLQDAAEQGRPGDRRSQAMPRGGDRRPRAEIRRRHHHPARFRGVRHRRQQTRRAVLRRRCSRRSRPARSPSWPANSNSIRRRWKRPSATSMRRLGPAPSITPSLTIAAPRASRRRRRTGRGKSRRRLIMPTRCGPASPSPISAPA